MTRYVDGQHQDTGADSDGRDEVAGQDVPAISTERARAVAGELRTMGRLYTMATEDHRSTLYVAADMLESATERAAMLQAHIDEANANAPRALVDALEALTRRSVELENARKELVMARSEIEELETEVDNLNAQLGDLT